jgi:hypothetical protein
VDRPANAQAMVSLFKRDNSQEEVIKMTKKWKPKLRLTWKKKAVVKKKP